MATTNHHGLGKAADEKGTPAFEAAVETGLIAAGLAGLFFFIPHEIGSDGVARYRALEDLWTQGRWSDTPYSMIGPLFSSPLWLLGRICGCPAWWCARFNFFVFALGLLALHRIGRGRMDAGVLRKFILLLVAASMFPNHLRTYLGEVFTAVLAGAGILAVALHASAWGWAALVLAAASAPAALAGLGLVAAYHATSRKQWRYLLVLAAAAGLVLGEAWLRRGHPLRTGYEGDAGYRTVLPYSGLPEFSYPFLFGVLSIFLSFGKGLLFFAPGLFLPPGASGASLSNGLREAYRLWLLFLLGLILVSARWWSWYGGWAWGPRFLLFASIPASFALAARLHRPGGCALGRAATLLALALSVWAALSGAVFNQDQLELCTGNVAMINQDSRELLSASYFGLEFLTWYVPEFSVLWRPFVVRRELGPSDLLLLLYGAAVFLWLGVPLATSLARELWASAGTFVASRMDFKSWRF